MKPEEWGGFRAKRRNPITGGWVAVVKNDEAGLDTFEKWSTVCDVHNTVTSHRTLRQAQSWLQVPVMWCEPCGGVEPMTFEYDED